MTDYRQTATALRAAHLDLGDILTQMQGHSVAGPRLRDFGLDLIPLGNGVYGNSPAGYRVGRAR